MIMNSLAEMTPMKLHVKLHDFEDCLDDSDPEYDFGPESIDVYDI